MSHLTDEQLAAELDRPRSGPPSDAASRHLEGCEVCRARLAEMAALEADLGRVLDHDPGEAYFSSFAERVAARIAGERPAMAAPDRERRTGWLAWWNSPRRLALAGGALALAAVVALAVVVGRDGGLRSIGEQVREPSAAGAEAQRVEAPPASQQVRERRGGEREAPIRPEAAPPSNDMADARADEQAGAGSQQSLEREAGGRETGALSREAPSAAPRRAMEVRTLPGGEQVLVPPAGMPEARRKGRAVVPPSGFRKPGAEPMASGAAAGKNELAAPAQPEAPAELKAREAGGEDRASSGMPRTQGAGAPVPVVTKSLADSPGASTPAPTPGRDVPPAPARSAARAPEAPAPAGTGGVLQPRDELVRDAARTTKLCGTVRDPNGRPIGGVVLSAAESGASATSAADGSFCVEVPGPRATLEAFAVGFRPHRDAVPVGADGASVGIVLQPVATLATDARWGSARSTFKALTDATGPPAPPSDAAQVARAATDAASRGGTVELWQRAADAWTDVAMRPAGTPAALAEARFHVAEARVNAWRIGRTVAERAAARAAVDDYLPIARSNAERVLAEGWKRALER